MNEDWRKDALIHELAETVWHDRLVLAAVIGLAAFFTAETWVPNIAAFISAFLGRLIPLPDRLDRVWNLMAWVALAAPFLIFVRRPDTDLLRFGWSPRSESAASGEGDQTSSEEPGGGSAYLGASYVQTVRNRVMVRRVDPGSPAAIGGLMAGDTIVSIDDQEVRSVDAFEDVLDDKIPGESVELLVKRRGRTAKLAITLGSASPQSTRSP